MDVREMQKGVWDNKIKHGFSLTNVEREFCLLYGEVGEAYHAYKMKEPDLGAELADVALYLLGISEILGFSLEDEIEKKLDINRHRKYITVNGKEIKIDDREQVNIDK